MAEINWDLSLSPKHIGLMGHVIADYPSPEAVRSMIQIMAEAGAKVIEIQIPFSEPMADGALFLAANHKALAQGVDYAAALALMREVSQKYPAIRFLFMSYLNIVYQQGYARFVAEAAESGASGVIIPDLPVDYALPLESAGYKHDFVIVRVIPPNAGDERLKTLANGANGLIYAVARAGVTGAHSDFTPVRDFVRRLREKTKAPIAVGFGVRGVDDIRSLHGVADLAVIGSASLQTNEERGLSGLRHLWEDLSSACKSGPEPR